MGSQGDNGRRTRRVVVGSWIICLLTELAKMVVMGSEDIATVVSAALHLCNHIETFILLEEHVFHIDLYTLGILREVWGYPDDRFLLHSLAICLVELQRCFPCVKEAGTATFILALQLLEVGNMLVGKHEIAHHKSTLILRCRKVSKNLFGVVVERVDIINLELALQPRVEFPQGKIYSRDQPSAIYAYIHLARKGVYIQFERLADNLVSTNLGKLLGNPTAGLVRPVLGITATLKFCGTEFLDNLLVMYQILSANLHSHNSQHQKQQFFHIMIFSYKCILCFHSIHTEETE